MTTDSEIIEWLQEWHTLHWCVEALYVVDGYQVSICHDGNDLYGPFHGEALRDAYVAAMDYCRIYDVRRT